MKLEEAFEKYDDKVKLKRPNYNLSFTIRWLKQLKAWGNQESRDMGFLIPQPMIDDANADDWEVIE